MPVKTNQQTGYNADGQRILKEYAGHSHQFYVMDGMQTLAVLDQNGLSHFNIVGNGTEGRVKLDGSALTNRRYYLKDHLGSTREVISATDATLETFDYYPFGLLMPQRNTTDAGTLEQFTGKERDTEADLNLDYFGARYYDAAIGRWNGVDPLADKKPNLSPYNYVRNNPLLFIDPDGLDDYRYDDETGELIRIKKTEDEHDRIVKTDKDGNVKKKGEGILGFLVSKKNRGKAKVAVDDIEKGILKDGLNLKENNGSFEVNGEGQPSLEGFDKFISEFSDYIKTEIAGVRLGDENSNEVSRVLTYKYKNNTRTTSQTPTRWFSQFGGLLKAHFHTHPYDDHNPSEKYDILLRNRYPNLPFLIIAGGHAQEY